jgi:hypothetical protein
MGEIRDSIYADMASGKNNGLVTVVPGKGVPGAPSVNASAAAAAATSQARFTSSVDKAEFIKRSGENASAFKAVGFASDDPNDTRTVSEAEWMRGFVATMDQSVFTPAEALVSVCLAIGKIGNNLTAADDVLNEPDVWAMILGDAGTILLNDPEDQDCMRAALKCLFRLSSLDILNMSGPCVWKLCHLLLLMFPVCPVSSRIAPLAMRWIQHTRTQREHEDHQKAVVLMAKFFQAHGHPDRSIILVERLIVYTHVYAKMPPSMVAALRMYLGTFLCATDQYEQALEAYRLAIAMNGKDGIVLPAYLLIELHEKAATLCRGLDRRDEEFVHLCGMEDALNRTDPPFDKGPEQQEMVRYMLKFHRAVLIGQMKYFTQSLALLMDMPPSAFDLWERRGCTPLLPTFIDQLQQHMLKDRDMVDTGCDWRMCNWCCRIAKGLQHCPCTTVWYCGDKCQDEDWDRHKRACPMCRNCHKFGFDFESCSQCQTARFCSQECLNAAWPWHQEECTPPPPIVADIKEEEAADSVSFSDDEEEGETTEELTVEETMVMAAETPTMAQYAALAEHVGDRDAGDYEGWFDTLINMIGKRETETAVE